jgi:FkbM family methyltransferase
MAPGARVGRANRMTTHRPISELVSARRRGDLSRDDYWAAMKDAHIGLLEYPDLVGAAGVAAVEITPTGLRLRLDEEVRIEWDPSDVRSPPAVLLNEGAYEATEWTIVRALGTAARTMLDVGANIGWYSVRVAANRGERPGIHAFEPVPATFEKLEANVRLNGYERRIAPHAFGLSDRDEQVEFFVPERTGTVAASERPLFEAEAQTVAVGQIRRLDHVIRELSLVDIDLIKCDIEGGEFGFLRGAAETIETQQPTILLEMLRKWAQAFGYHPNDMIEWLRARGYVCGAIADGSVLQVESVTDETPQTNFLFVHATRLDAITSILRTDMVDVSLV